MYILLLLVLSNSLHTKLAHIDALSFRFQLEMTMCTKSHLFSKFTIISPFCVFTISCDNCRFDYF